MRGDTSELVNRDHRPFNAICDGPFTHILISDWSSVLSNIMKRYLLIFQNTLRKHLGFR